MFLARATGASVVPANFGGRSKKLLDPAVVMVPVIVAMVAVWTMDVGLVDGMGVVVI